jgi:hypothetical protein
MGVWSYAPAQRPDDAPPSNAALWHGSFKRQEYAERALRASVATDALEYCGKINAGGGFCSLGSGHEGKCTFGKLRLTDKQEAMLLGVALGHCVFFKPTPADRAVARALARKGLAVVTGLELTVVEVELTPAGRRAVDDLRREGKGE